MKKLTSLLFVLALSSTAAFAADDKPSPIGYSDTPIIPGTQWKVHDIDRPRPEAVTPGEKLGHPPADAIILFDGKMQMRFCRRSWMKRVSRRRR